MIPDNLKEFLLVTICTKAISLENKNLYEDVCRKGVDPPGGGEQSREKSNEREADE